MKLTYAKVLSLEAAHLAIDAGYTVQAPNQQGQLVAAQLPFILKGDGRMTLIRNLTAIKAHSTEFTKWRADLIKEKSGGKDRLDPKDIETIKAFLAEDKNMRESEIEDEIKLKAFTEAQLDLSSNQLPYEGCVSVLIEHQLFAFSA